MFEEINVFSMQPYGKDKSLSTLCVSSVPTTTFVQGKFIEKQYKIKDKYIIFTSFNAPIDELLGIYLLDDKYAICDHIQVTEVILISGYAYFDNPKIINENQLSFEFIDERPWILTLLEQPTRMGFCTPFCAGRLFSRLFSLKYLKLSH